MNLSDLGGLPGDPPGDPPGDRQDRPMTKFREDLPTGIGTIGAALPFVTALASTALPASGRSRAGDGNMPGDGRR